MGQLAWCCVVRVCSLGIGRLHAMRWSSVTLSAILGKVVSKSLPYRTIIKGMVN